MNRRTVLILAAALVCLVAVLLTAEWVNDTGQPSGKPLFPEMRNDINTVTTITVTGSGDEVVATLVKQGDEWSVSERDGYPADTGKLRQLLLGLADARLVEAKTANPSYYSRLGVEDIGAEDAGGVLVQVIAQSSQYSVIVGDQTPGDYRYVRREGEAGSWLIDKNPEAPSETADWLHKAIVDVDATEVRGVSIEHPDGQTIRLLKTSADEPDFVVTEIPAGRELSYAGIGNVVGGVLDNLTLDDVSPATELTPEAVITTFETFDGRVIRISSEALNTEHWIQLSASHDPSLPAGEAASDAVLPDASDQAASVDSQVDVAAGVEALNQRTDGWRYRIPQYKYEQLTRRWQDLLKDTD